MGKLRKISMLLALMVYLTGIPVSAGQPQSGEKLTEAQLQEETKQYTDRFIVRYVQPEQKLTELEEHINQAFEKAKKQKHQTVPTWDSLQGEIGIVATEEQGTDMQMNKMPTALRDALRPQREQTEMLEEEGSITILLEEKVDPTVFTANLLAQSEDTIAYVQPDYILELSEEDIGQEEQIIQETDFQEEDNPVQGQGEIEPKEEMNTEERLVEITLQPPEEIPEPAQVGAQVLPEGQQVTVAVLDSAVDVTHPELVGRIAEGYDFCNDTQELVRQQPDMEAVHGTHIAGTIAQEAPEAVIMPLVVFRNGKAYTSDIIRAISYAKEHGAQIVNCSWGGTENNLALREAMEASGLFFVCAAGNSRTNLDENPVYPACFGLDNAISIAALNEDMAMSYFSNYGVQQVELAAIGRDHSGPYPGGGYDTMSGTSVSAAVVTGAAAQFAAVYGTDQLKVSLTYSADKISCLEGKVKGAAALNVQHLLAAEEGEQRIVQPEDDFDVLAPTLSTEESWSLFQRGDNIQVATGADAVMVLKSNGSVWRIDYNTFVPRQVPGLRDIMSISVYGYYMIAMGKNGKVYTGGTGGYALEEKDSISNAVAVASGYNYFLVLKSDGTVWGWGQNESGQTGFDEPDTIYWPSFLSNDTPAQVKTYDNVALSGVRRIYASQSTSFAIKEDGTAYRWGVYSSSWEFTCSAEPFAENIDEITTSGTMRCAALDKNGQMHLFTNSLSGGETISNTVFQNVLGISQNTIVKTDGMVWHWNNQAEGYPTQRVSGLYDVRQASQYSERVFAVKMDGTVWQWDYVNGTPGTPVQRNIPIIEPAERQTIVQEWYNAADNPAAFKDQSGLEALGWSEYNEENKSGNNWQTPSMGEFTAIGGQLCIQKTSTTDEPLAASDQALVYSVDKVFTRRQESWNGDERLSLWTQNFKGDYEVELDGMFQQQGGFVYYDIMGKSSTGVPSIAARYRVDPYVTGAFNVYNNKLNGGNTNAYPLWTNSQVGRVISTVLHSSDSTFQTFMNGNLIPASTTVKDAFPSDTFSMSGWNKAQPGAYITGIRISAQKRALAGDTIAKINKLSLREISKIQDVTDNAAAQISMKMLTSTPEAVTGNLNALPSTLAGAQVTWSSSYPQIITDDGTYVARPYYNTDVVMTAKLTNPSDGFTQYVEFRLTVLGSSGMDQPYQEKILVEEQYGNTNNDAYHLNQQELEAIGWMEADEPNKSGNNWQTPALGTFSAESGKLVIQKTGSTAEPVGAPAGALCYAVNKTFTYRQNNWKGDPHISVWTQNFKGDYDIVIDASFHQTGSKVFYDILGCDSYGTDKIVGRYAIDPGINGTFDVYNNKLNGGSSNYYPLWKDPGQRHSIKTSLHSSTATFQTFVDGSVQAAQTTVADANPKDTFSMTNWNATQPGVYIKGIQINAQKQAAAGDTIAILDSVKLIERQAQRDSVDDALDQLSMFMLTDTPDFVTENLKTLPNVIQGMQVTWRSNRPELMSDNGEILQEVVFDETVVMTAKITNPANGFTKYADFTLRLVKKQGFAQKFTQNVVGQPSGDGQPGSTILPEIEGWTFRYPGISNGTNGETHDAQILVRDEALIFKKISDRQTDNYQICLEGVRPLSRTESAPQWEGKYDLSFKAKAQGTGTFRFAPLSSNGVQPFVLMLDASLKKLTISYGKEQNGTWQQVQQDITTINPTVEHNYRISIDTTGNFIVYVDEVALETADGSQTRGFLPGTGSYFNLSKLSVWITNITMENTEMGFLKDIVFSPTGNGGTQAVPPAEINVPVESGEVLEVKVLASGIQNLNQTIFTVMYDETLLTVEDAAGAVFGVQLQPGSYGNIEITAVEDGVISFRIISPVTHTVQRWTGVLNILKFRAIGSGIANLEVQHE